MTKSHFSQGKKQHLPALFSSRPHLQHPHSLCSGTPAPRGPGTLWGPHSVCSQSWNTLLQEPQCSAPFGASAQMAPFQGTCPSAIICDLCSPTFLMLILLFPIVSHTTHLLTESEMHFLMYHLSPHPPECTHPDGRNFSFCPDVSQHLGQCPTHSRYLINICWLDERSLC